MPSNRPPATVALLAAIVIFIPFSGCNGGFSSGALANARKAMAKEQYDKALNQLDTGDMFAGSHAEWKAKIAGLRAECHERRGRPEEAVAVYEHLVEHYPESPEARLAEKRIASIGNSIALTGSLR